MSLDPEWWSPPVAIAHRGSRVLWPENTDTSFQGAYDLGYRHFETDLHITADGVIVCFHDPTVERTTQGTGRVEEMTLAELQELDPGYRHGSLDGGYTFRGEGSRIPTLEWLLGTYQDVAVVVDLKCDGLAQPLTAVVDDLGAHERVIVGSFSDSRLAEFRRVSRSQIPTSTGPAVSRLWVMASRMGRGVPGDAAALQLPTRMRGIRVVDEKLVAAAHGYGLQVHAWTVNEPGEMTRLLEMGVDGIITDRPDLLKEVLIDREEWPS